MAVLHGVVEWEDLDVFFNEFALGAILYLPTADHVMYIQGIFETPYLKRDFGAFIVDQEAPSFTCKWDDEFAAVRKGDRLFVNRPASDEDIDTAYRLTSRGGASAFFIDSIPQNDGTGVVSFILTAASTQDAEGDELDDMTVPPDDPSNLFG